MSGDQHPRGVFEPGFTDIDGRKMLLAVDSEGRLVARAAITDEDRRGLILDAFRDLLRAQDPDPELVVLD